MSGISMRNSGFIWLAMVAGARRGELLALRGAPIRFRVAGGRVHQELPGERRAADREGSEVWPGPQGQRARRLTAGRRAHLLSPPPGGLRGGWFRRPRAVPYG